jgi:hypothetical protein
MDTDEFEEGISIDAHVIKRYGSTLGPAQIEEQVAGLLSDPRCLHRVTSGFRNDADILPLDV